MQEKTELLNAFFRHTHAPDRAEWIIREVAWFSQDGDAAVIRGYTQQIK